MRIALFGGTFDPPHLGHVHIAAAAADRLRLDRVLFAPTGRQPLKAVAPLASFADRLAMTQLAVAMDSRFAASDIDAPHPQGAPNFTVDTLATLRQQHPEADSIFHIVGADSFLTLPLWREPLRLLALAEWIIVTRPGSEIDEDVLHSVLNKALGPRNPTPEQLSRVHLLTGIAEDVSATSLRSRIQAGDDVSSLLPPGVPEYIAAHHLYRSATGLS